MRTLDEIFCEPAYIKQGRPRIGDEAMTPREHKVKHHAKKRAEKLSRVAILDFETDPFNAKDNETVFPFLAVLYSDEFDPVVIWDEEPERFIDSVIRAIEGLPDRWTIYAHNGGKFDYMFLLHRLRGDVQFKGRGIMCAKIGAHDLRDSFHIIPERLANWQKDDFDYSNMKRGKRTKHKKEIIEYCINDCKYLLEIVKKFLGDHGFKLSIGQAAMAYLRKEYKVERIGDAMDNFLRSYFFGGRVECLAGMGHFHGDYKLYDVNSMYPYVMANYQHPIGNQYRITDGSRIPPDTIFVQLHCTNYGGLVRRGDNNETSAEFETGMFFTTIWEYRTALKYGLISNPKVFRSIQCNARSDFSRTIVPLYENRIATKRLLKTLAKGSYEYNEAKKDDMVMKFLLNNMFGKFAQNPRRYKEHYLTDPNECPPKEETGYGALPAYECSDYWIWERPNPSFRFNNVGTAASITGAARAVLMEAIQLAKDPIYCDTDSLICRDLSGVTIDGTALGAWDIESEFSEVIVCGKKMYACKVAGIPDGHKDQIKIRSKGVSGRTWADFVAMLDGQIIEVLNNAPTLTKTGQQYYMRRNIRATAPRIEQPRHRRKRFVA